MFERNCLPLLALLILSISAAAQMSPTPPPETCDITGLDAKVSVLINQNDQLRQTLQNAIDSNKVNQIIEASITEHMQKQAAAFHAEFTTIFMAMSMFILGGIVVTYWFFVSKLKKVIGNG